MNQIHFKSILRVTSLFILMLIPAISLCQEGSIDSVAPKKPSLEELMAKFAEHEARYLPFHISYLSTFRMADGISNEIRQQYPWGDGKLHEVETEVAQAEPLNWMKVESGIVNHEVQSTYKMVCTTEGIHHFSEPGAGTRFVAHSEYPFRFASASPLLGIFPLRMTWPSNGVLLSEYFTEDPSRVKLSWDGPNAVLTLEFGASETFRSRYVLWLADQYDWHPIRMQRFENVTDQDFSEEWEATAFYHSTIGRQVRSGNIRRRDRPNRTFIRPDSKEPVIPDHAQQRAAETGPVGSTEQRHPIAYSIEFKAGNTTYGSNLNESLFAIAAPKSRIGDLTPGNAIGPHFAANPSSGSLRSHPQSVEATYINLEQSALQVARDYRAEAAQETSDPNALAELKEKLVASVKATFEAQMNLQQVRIQIAQQDLAEVVAKHQRRQSLADKIIERRIEDLINGDDLEWATRKKEPSATFSKKTSASRGPISDAVKDRATVQELVDDWSKRTRALGDNAMEQRDLALSEIATALQSDDVIQLQAATTALARLGDVNCDKPLFRPHLVKLVRAGDGDIQTMAFHALYNTDRREGDLKLLQDVLSKSHSDLLEYSALQLLLMFGDGVIDSASEDIVLNLLNSPDSTVRRQTLKGLFGIEASDRLTARVIELVEDNESRDDAIDCVLALSSAKNAAVIDKLIEVLSDSEWKIRDRALNGLRYGVPESQQAKVAAALLQMYESRSDFDTRKRCSELIQIHGDSSQRDTLARFQKSSE